MSCECPICMDVINTTKNCVVTECGHTFHANCLMTSVAHNGFGCPYCRTAMAQEVADEESEYGSEYDDQEDDDEDVLRGFRLFMANAEDEEVDEEDVIQEEYEKQLLEVAEEREREHELDRDPIPTISYLESKLLEQGITMNDMVKIAVQGFEAFESQTAEFERVDGAVFGKLCGIIKNYKPPTSN